MIFHSRAVAEFWDRYDALSESVRVLADKQYSLFRVNPFHPSLRFKQIGSFCSVRVNLDYRALARRNEFNLVWFWIGAHDEYDRLAKRRLV